MLFQLYAMYKNLNSYKEDSKAYTIWFFIEFVVVEVTTSPCEYCWQKLVSRTNFNRLYFQFVFQKLYCLGCRRIIQNSLENVLKFILVI